MKILTAPQSGSQAGTTASRNRFGQYLRTRATPVQPRTPKQGYGRSIFTVGSSTWRNLTTAQQTAWNDYAAQILRSDSLGSSYSPTGHELYVGSTIGYGAVTPDAPVELPTYSLTIVSVAYVDPTPGPEALTLTLAFTNPDNKLIVETSGPISPGVTSSAGVRRWRTLPVDASNLIPNQFSMGSTSVALLTNYNYLFPSPTPGQVIWFRFREMFYDSAGLATVVNNSRPTVRLVVA